MADGRVIGGKRAMAVGDSCRWRQWRIWQVKLRAAASAAVEDRIGSASLNMSAVLTLSPTLICVFSQTLRGNISGMENNIKSTGAYKDGQLTKVCCGSEFAAVAFLSNTKSAKNIETSRLKRIFLE